MVIHNPYGYRKPCEGCRQTIAIVRCRDNHWRPFELRTVAAAPSGVWAWHRERGMEETDLTPGNPIHYCPEYEIGRMRLDPTRALSQQEDA